jgi:hypothetical protein
MASLLSGSIINCRRIEDLRAGDYILDNDGKLVPIIRIWKTRETDDIIGYFFNYVICSSFFLVKSKDSNWTHACNLSNEYFLMTAYMYRIETENYGIRIDNFSFETWTTDYIDKNPEVISKYFLVE